MRQNRRTVAYPLKDATTISNGAMEYCQKIPSAAETPLGLHRKWHVDASHAPSWVTTETKTVDLGIQLV